MKHLYGPRIFTGISDDLYPPKDVRLTASEEDYSLDKISGESVAVVTGQPAFFRAPHVMHLADEQVIRPNGLILDAVDDGTTQ